MCENIKCVAIRNRTQFFVKNWNDSGMSFSCPQHGSEYLYITDMEKSFSKHRPSGPMLSISWNVCLSVCLSVRVFTFEVPFKCLFAPTSRSRMSNIFRDGEFLGKSNEKKWSQIWTFLFWSGPKLPNKKIVFFGWFCLTKQGGNHASWWIRDLWSKGVSLILAYF